MGEGVDEGFAPGAGSGDGASVGVGLGVGVGVGDSSGDDDSSSDGDSGALGEGVASSLDSRVPVGEANGLDSDSAGLESPGLTLQPASMIAASSSKVSDRASPGPRE